MSEAEPLESIVSEIGECGRDRDDRQSTRSSTADTSYLTPPSTPTSIDWEGEVEVFWVMMGSFQSVEARLQNIRSKKEKLK